MGDIHGKSSICKVFVLTSLCSSESQSQDSHNSAFQYLGVLQVKYLGRCYAGVSYSNDLYGGLEEDLEEPYHADDHDHDVGQITTFAVSSSLYTPLSAREHTKLPARPLSRLGTPRSLAQQCVSSHSVLCCKFGLHMFELHISM